MRASTLTLDYVRGCLGQTGGSRALSNPLYKQNHGSAQADETYEVVQVRTRSAQANESYQAVNTGDGDGYLDVAGAVVSVAQASSSLAKLAAPALQRILTRVVFSAELALASRWPALAARWQRAGTQRLCRCLSNGCPDAQPMIC